MTTEPPTLEELNQKMPPNRDGILLLLPEGDKKKLFASLAGKWVELADPLSKEFQEEQESWLKAIPKGAFVGGIDTLDKELVGTKDKGEALKQ